MCSKCCAADGVPYPQQSAAVAGGARPTPAPLAPPHPCARGTTQQGSLGKANTALWVCVVHMVGRGGVDTLYGIRYHVLYVIQGP